MEIANVKSSAVKAIDSATSEQTSDALPRPAGLPTAEAPLDPERVTISKLHAFREKHYGSSEMPLSIEKTLAFLYSQPNMLVNAARENDLELLNVILDISIKTQSEDEGDNILHRMAELKEHISNNTVGGNVFLALAKNRWPEAHKAIAEHGKTWTADQWLAFLEDIEDTFAFDYTPFNVHDISSDDWEQITQDWDPKLKQRVFNKLIHLSSVQPSDPLSRKNAEYNEQRLFEEMKENAEKLFSKMEINAKTRKQIVIGFIKDDVDVDHFCSFLSALERQNNPEIYRATKDYFNHIDQKTVQDSSSLQHLSFLATHSLAAEFSQFFKPDSWTEKDQWLSILLTLAEHNHGKVVLEQVKSAEIKDADFWTSLLEAASNIVEVGELAELAEKAVPGKIDLKLIQSCKASTEELKKLNAHEWECCAKTKTGHIFRPNHNELKESYNPDKSLNTAFPAVVPLLQPSQKPFRLFIHFLEQLNNPFAGTKIHSLGTSVSNPAQFSIPDPLTLEAVLRAKCRHLRIHRFPKNYTSEDAKESVPLLSIKLNAGIADDRPFIELLLEGDVIISFDKEQIHDFIAHLIPIIKTILGHSYNGYVICRDQRRELSRKALTLIDNDTKLDDEMKEPLLTVLGAMNDRWSTYPSNEPKFGTNLESILGFPNWQSHLKKHYEGIDLDKLRAEALRVFAPLL